MQHVHLGSGFRPLLFVLACLLAATAFAQVPKQRVRGEVVSLEGTKLALRTRSGQPLSITLDEGYGAASFGPSTPR